MALPNYQFWGNVQNSDTYALTREITSFDSSITRFWGTVGDPLEESIDVAQHVTAFTGTETNYQIVTQPIGWHMASDTAGVKTLYERTVSYNNGIRSESPSYDYDYNFVETENGFECVYDGYAYNVNIVYNTVTYPIFDVNDAEGIAKYIQTGDDSSALNYDDLHVPEYDFFLDNDGQEIKIKYNLRTDNHAQNIRYEFYSYPSFELITTLYGLTSQAISWNSLGKILTHCYVFIYGESSTKDIFKLSAECKRALLSVIGSTSAEAIIAESNGSTLKCSTNGKYDDISTDSDEISDAQPSEDEIYETALSTLTTTYKITKTQMADFGNWLWGDLFDDIRKINISPLENIISVKCVPCNIDGTNSAIRVGNLNTNIDAIKLGTTLQRKLVGSFDVPVLSYGFMNYDPFTNIQLYLPLHGMINLSANDCVGHRITIYINYDVVVGTFGYLVYTSKGGGETLIYACEGNCAIDLPLSSSNRAQAEMGIVSNLLDVGMNVANMNVGGLSKDLSSIVNTQYHYQNFGSPSSQIGSMNPNKCYIIIRYPIPSVPSSFAHTNGYACNSTYQLKDLQGYTVCDNVDLDGFDCTEDEKEQIKNLLTSGFYI